MTGADVPPGAVQAGAAVPPLVVIGPMGAGKSSVGRRVAKALGVPFTDTDRVIAREHGPIPKLFAERGEPAFRELEAAAVRRAVQIGGVVSVGGGSGHAPGDPRRDGGRARRAPHRHGRGGRRTDRRQ
ncbi:shikimate kinase [Curtobacterium sp. MCPF17_052]|uniref:shikimate kinase n=1 Tax=Curtobacterium sp. MCPF17_052 TaxID=2175655 RepID=UPI00346441A0